MDTSQGDDKDDRDWFSVLYRTTAHRVRAYVARHATADDVDEIVGDTYLTAWRRRDRIDLADPVPWLLVTARHVIANRRRLGARRELPHVDLETVAAAVPSVDGPVVRREVALAALATLTAAEREAVLLVAWDGLDREAAARVAGCSVRAFTVRLHRARLRIARHVDGPPETADAAEHGRSRRIHPPSVVKELS